MDKITICDLELHARVGVPDEERAVPQRLLVTVEMWGDFRAAAKTDDLGLTIDYYAVSRRLLALGRAGEWRLIERLAWEMGQMLREEFGVEGVRVGIKKFILPEARWVEVTMEAGRRLG